MPAGRGAIGAKPTTKVAPTYVGHGTYTTASGTAITLPLPASLATNDYLIAVVACPAGSDIGSGSNGSGGGAWTRLAEFVNGSSKVLFSVFGHKYTSGDPSVVANMAASTRSLLGMTFAFRGVDTTTPMDVAAVTATPAASAVAAAITSVTDNALLVQIWYDVSSNSPYVSAIDNGFTLALGGSNFGNNEIGIAYQAKTPPGASGTTTWTVPLPGGGGKSLALALRPA